jgi:hypothetical protein
MKTIIEMARDAGLVFNEEHGTDIAKSIHLGRVQAFAALVLANTDPQSSMAWQEGNEAGRRSEREACANVADEHMKECEGKSFGVGAAIRARGNT